MLRRSWAPLLACALALFAAACGESQEEKYEQGFQTVNDEILSLAQDFGRSISRAEGKSDAQIGAEFGALAERMGELQQDVDELDPPDELKPDQEQLVQAMGDVQGDLEAIEKAAEDGDPAAARSATAQLFSDSRSLAEARRRLARATGAELGPSS